MFAMLEAAPIPPPPHIDTHDTWQDFVHRLFSNDWRWIIGLIIAIAVFSAVANVRSALVSALALFAAVGSFWLWWHIFNQFAHHATPLFLGESSPKTLWDAIHASGWAEGVAVISVILGIWTLIAIKKHLVIKILAGVGVWAGCMLFYSLIVVEFQIPHLLYVWWTQMTG